ncbi:MAG: LacI family DNA-binding transcriptional regulator [Armatimonadetes bacterium]|nr:LacI family DNA-binding transcriptional regulator [Armatimonadota bacterium]
MTTSKTVTLKDVAERAHVSQSVVSTVLNDRQNGIFVSEGTRRNVLQAAEALGYAARHRPLPPVRRPGRRAPAGHDPHLVGVLLGRRFGGSLFTDTFYGVNAALAPQGYHPLVLDTYAEAYSKASEKEAECLRYAHENNFAGIVLWHEGDTANVPLIREISAEMPVIAIDRRVPGVPLDFVGTDNYAGAYEATRHLIQLGHTRIAHLTRLESTAAAVERLRGYQQALADAGLEADPRHILLALDRGRRLDANMVRQAFAAEDRPTAIFLLADFWAPPVYAELRGLGLRVPEDVALVGFDDVIQPGLSDLELTSMAQDFEGIGRTAGECVLRRIAQPGAPPVTQVFPARLVVRRSSGVAAPDPSPAPAEERAAVPAAPAPPPVSRSPRRKRSVAVVS